MYAYVTAEPGDVGFTANPSLMGRSIRYMTRSKGEAPTKANHTLMFTTEGLVGPLVPAPVPLQDQARCIEALWHVKEHAWYERNIGTGQTIWVFSPTFLEPGDREKIVANARQHLGARYGWWKLLTFLAERQTGIKFTRLHFIDGRPICSYLISNSYAEEGYPYAFGKDVPYQSQSPDDQFDFCEASGLWEFRGKIYVAQNP